MLFKINKIIHRTGNLFIYICFFILFSILLSANQNQPKIIGIMENGIMINIGSGAGVSTGAEGKVYYEETISGQKINNYIVRFRVTAVDKETCTAIIIQKTKDPQIGYWVVFDSPLQAKSAKTETKKTDEAKESKADLNVPSGKAIEWYISEGDKKIELNDYLGALKYFEKAYAIDESDPVVLEKIASTRKFINAPADEKKYLEQINQANYFAGKNKIDFAFEYLLAAFRNYPYKKPETLGRLKMLAGQYPREWREFMKSSDQDSLPFTDIQGTETAKEVNGEMAADEERIILSLKNILFSTKAGGIHTAVNDNGTLYGTQIGLYYVSAHNRFECEWKNIIDMSVKRALGLFDPYLKIVSSKQMDVYFYGASRKQFDVFCAELANLRNKYMDK